MPANAQRATLNGNYELQKILENTSLFNVAEDPVERANLNERNRDIYIAIRPHVSRPT